MTQDVTQATNMQVQKKFTPTPRKVIGIPRGRGVLKVKILEIKYEAKLEFPGGRGMQNKKPSVWEYEYFVGLHNDVLCIL